MNQTKKTVSYQRAKLLISIGYLLIVLGDGVALASGPLVAGYVARATLFIAVAGAGCIVYALAAVEASGRAYVWAAALALLGGTLVGIGLADKL